MPTASPPKKRKTSVMITPPSTTKESSKEVTRRTTLTSEKPKPSRVPLNPIIGKSKSKLRQSIATEALLSLSKPSPNKKKKKKAPLILELRLGDVLCGNADLVGGHGRAEGNRDVFRMIDAYLPLYSVTSAEQKTSIAKEIVNHVLYVRRGRFLTLDMATECFKELSYEKALDKVRDTFSYVMRKQAREQAKQTSRIDEPSASSSPETDSKSDASHYVHSVGELQCFVWYCLVRNDGSSSHTLFPLHVYYFYYPKMARFRLYPVKLSPVILLVVMMLLPTPICLFNLGEGSYNVPSGRPCDFLCRSLFLVCRACTKAWRQDPPTQIKIFQTPFC